MISIAVVGHTNVGKTSLLRTLTRRADFGEVADGPGTTRHVEAVTLDVDGRPVLRFLDTPGLEDATALLTHLQQLDAALPRVERVRAFLRGAGLHGAQDEFEQEAKVLRSLLEMDAGLLVIDAREAPLPKFAAEIEILMLCGRPLMPVLNYVREPSAQEPAWRALLASHGLHAHLRFDAVAPFIGAEAHLYSDLGALLPERRGALQGVIDHLARERADRHSASLRLIAGLLLGLAALRAALPQDTLADEGAGPGAKQAFVRQFRGQVTARTRAAMDQLLALHGFGRDTAEAADLPLLAGRWEDDLFNPEALKRAGQQFGTGAAIGGALGLAADVALAGLSLGAAASLGAAIGGMASQGFGPLGRKLANKLRGVLELTLEDATLLRIAAQQLTLLQALTQRGHAALSVLSVLPGETGVAGVALEGPPLLRALRPARAHPEWAQAAPSRARDRQAEVLVALLR